MNAEELEVIRDVERQESSELAWFLPQADLWCDRHDFLRWYREYSVWRIGDDSYSSGSMGRS
jgi:hypothetical protein